MSWEKPEFRDISLAMECSSYANADDFDVEQVPSDPTTEF
jgi:coenzyme PQQ precursor peptide PqqA